MHFAWQNEAKSAAQAEFANQPTGLPPGLDSTALPCRKKLYR